MDTPDRPNRPPRATLITGDYLMWLYLIHFEEPLSHAKHYLGMSNKLQRRLYDHARGQGARIMQVLHEKDIHWTLAALYVPKGPKQNIEILAKRMKKSPRYCPICNKNPPPFPGTTEYPIPSKLICDSQTLRQDLKPLTQRRTNVHRKPRTHRKKH